MPSTNCFHFKAGQWHPLDEPPFDCAEDEDWNEAAKRAGYSCATVNRDTVEIWSAGSCTTPTTERFPWLVCYSPANDCVFNLFVDNPQDFALLISQLAPTALLQVAESLFDQIHDFTEKVFRAWHGHSLWGACMACDPIRVQHQAECRRRREAEQRSAPRRPAASEPATR